MSYIINEDQPAKILVIDDDPYLVEVISTSLRLLGNYRVMSAVDGAQGLDYCLRYQPDLAIIDISMPRLDGYQVVRALRGDSRTEDIPIVILSAKVQRDDHIVGMLAGADAYLDKPLNPMQLVEAIRQSLALGIEQREARYQALAEESTYTTFTEGSL